MFKTTIVIFSRSAVKEAKVKQFAQGISQNRNIATTLIRQTERIAKATGLPVIHSVQQTGNTFGERLQNAIQAGFDQGYQQVIAIGNDSPNLTVNHLIRAKKQLDKQDIVLGPAHDGGVYLIGFNESNFKKLPFNQLRWQSDQLIHSFLKTIKTLKLSVFQLSTLTDIDNVVDLQLFLKQHSTTCFTRVVLAILKTIKTPFLFITTSINTFFFIQNRQRPPPFVLSPYLFDV